MPYALVVEARGAQDSERSMIINKSPTVSRVSGDYTRIIYSCRSNVLIIARHDYLLKQPRLRVIDKA
jgi:hypothetical protein